MNFCVKCKHEVENFPLYDVERELKNLTIISEGSYFSNLEPIENLVITEEFQDDATKIIYPFNTFFIYY